MIGSKIPRPRFSLFLLFLLFCLVGTISLAQEAEPEWISLFDGVSLEGWQRVEEGGSGGVSVRDGAMVIEMGVMGSGVVYRPAADKEFPKTDYEIEYTALRQLGNDFFAALTFPVGDACCTFVNGGWGGTLLGLSSIDGFDASENNTSSYFGFKNKIWYTFRVRVTERTIQVWLDDEQVVRTFLDGRQVTTRIEMNLFRPLGFAAWICEGHIRDIRYRTLSESEVAELSREADLAAGTKKHFPVD